MAKEISGMETPEDLEALKENREAHIKTLEERVDKLAAKVLEHHKLIAIIVQELFRHKQALLKIEKSNDPSKPNLWIPRA